MLADKTGVSHEQLEINEGVEVNELYHLLENKYPTLGNSKYRLAHNQALATDKLIIENNAEIALLPPFAGG